MRSQWPRGVPPGGRWRQHKLPGWKAMCTVRVDSGAGEGRKWVQESQEDKTNPGDQLGTSEQSQKAGKFQNELSG